MQRLHFFLKNFFFLLAFLPLCAEEVEKVGNFSLPPSQQPNALYGFGGNIIAKSEIQWSCFADDIEGKQKRIFDLIPSVVFGISDELSIMFSAPFTPDFRDGKCHSSGLEDFFVQMEWAFYNHTTSCYQDQATLVANASFPTGSAHRNPPTGFGAPSFFLGTTFYRTYVDWVFFTAQGAILPCRHDRIQFGDQFLYQFGASRTLPSPEGWIYALMLEVDGQYFRKNRVRGKSVSSSGGNVIYAIPSFWASSKYFIFQLGATFPVNQNLFGDQRKVDWGVALNIAWSIY